MERCKCSETTRINWGTSKEDETLTCNFCGLLAEKEYLVEGTEQEFASEASEYEYKHSLNKTIRETNIILSTTFEIPGRKISESLGMITGVGNAIFTLSPTTNRLTNRAATKALKNLFAEAERIEADAIVGINMAIDTHGTGLINQLVLVTGTAVRLQV